MNLFKKYIQNCFTTNFIPRSFILYNNTFKNFCSKELSRSYHKETVERANPIVKRIYKMEENILSFNEFKFIPELYKVLQKLEVHAPTSIQTAAIPSIMAKKNIFYASQTGTGKTFTYLLPLLNELKEQELASGGRLTLEKRPRALIIVPTRELVQQVYEVCKLFIHDVPLKVEAFYVGKDFREEKDESNKGIDILVTTPERFQNHWDKQNVFASKLTHLVVDELDTLLDAGNEEFLLKMCRLGQQANNTGHSIDKQIIFVSATLTPAINDFLKKAFGGEQNFVKIIDKSTNHNLANVRHEFLHVTDFDKFPTLLKLLNDNIKVIKQNFSIIIFCNSVSCARKTEMFLAENGFSTACLHGDIPSQRRKFELLKFKKRTAKILICTDLISRGLDWPFVYLVINFDFPKTLSDYIHRAGRTGRMGTKGVCVSFYRGFDVNIIERIKQATRMNLPMRLDYSMFSRRKENMQFQKSITKRLTHAKNDHINITKKFTKTELMKIKTLRRRKTLVDKFKQSKEDDQKKMLQKFRTRASRDQSMRDKSLNRGKRT
jgi:superfamily II DNA/RNA helicase